MSSKTKTTATKEEATPALVPKLRFPEFREAAAWEQTTLGAAARLKNGYAFKSADYVDSGPCQIITIANVQQGALALEAAKRIAQPPADIQAHQKLRIGDILISMTGNVGRVCRVTCDSLLLNQRVGKLMPEEIDPEFFYHSLQRDEFRNAMQLKAAGGAQGNLSGGDITDYPLHRPAADAEQQKIAECLSSVDELMAAQARKVDALQTHKKGLMQQLFPREGETQPRLRFPEFQNAGEWEVKKLEEIGRVIRGASPRPKGDPRYYGGPVPRLMVQDVTRDGKWVTPQIDSLTKEGAKLSRPCPAGTLTIVCSGAVGVVSFLAVDACIHDGFLALVDIDESLASKDFLFHRLSTLREQFERGATHGGVFTNLTTTGVDQLEIAFPRPAEQQRIAKCLSSLDALITAETQKHEALKTHKKGLMQQLFPSPEEVEA